MTAPTARGEEADGARRTRLRIVVIQALVFSLFATLLGRLYYLQVVSGEEYTAQAASQSVRDIVEQPQRGLIVDDMGRPLVTNRHAWVVSVDRSLRGKLPGTIALPASVTLPFGCFEQVGGVVGWRARACMHTKGVPLLLLRAGVLVAISSTNKPLSLHMHFLCCEIPAMHLKRVLSCF